MFIRVFGLEGHLQTKERVRLFNLANFVYLNRMFIACGGLLKTKNHELLKKKRQCDY